MLRFLTLLVVIAAVSSTEYLYPSGYRTISLPLTTTAYTYAQPSTSWSYSAPSTSQIYSAQMYRPAYSFGTYQYTYPTNSYSWQYQKQYQPTYQYASAITPRYSTVSYGTQRGARALAIAGTTPQQQIQPVQSYSQQPQPQVHSQFQSQPQQQAVAFVPVAVPTGTTTGLDQVRIHQQQAVQTQQQTPYIAGGLVAAPIQSQSQPQPQTFVAPQVAPQQQFVATVVVPVQAQSQPQQQQYHTGFQPAQTPAQAPVVFAPVQSSESFQSVQGQQQQQQFVPQTVVVSPQSVVPFIQPVAIPSVPVAYASGTPVVSAGGPAPVAPASHHQESLGHHQVSHVSIPGQVGVGGGYTSSAFYEAAPAQVVIPAESIVTQDGKLTGKIDHQQQHNVQGHRTSSVQSGTVHDGYQSATVAYQ